MKCRLAMSIVLAGLAVPSSLDAQRMGAVRSFAARPLIRGTTVTAVRPTPRPVRPGTPKPGPLGARRPRLGPGSYPSVPNSGYFPGTPCLTNPSYAGSFFCQQYLPRNGFSPLLSGFLSWFPFVPQEYPSEEQVPPPPVPDQETALARQVDRLTDEVEMLRLDQASRQPPPPAVAVNPEEKPPATVLVYQDGRQREVQNYAIQGETLYVFAGETTRRIHLADLNLEATQKLNEERGVEFTSPGLP